MKNLIEFLSRINLNGLIDQIILESTDEGLSVKCKDNFGLIAIYGSLKDPILKKTVGVNGVTNMLKIIAGNEFDKFHCSESAMIFKNENTKLEWKLGEVSTMESLSKSKEELMKLFSKNKITIDLSDNILSTIKKTISSTEFCDKLKFYTEKETLKIAGEDDVYHNMYESKLIDSTGEINNVYKKDYLSNVINSIDFPAKMEIDYIENKPYPIHIHGCTDNGIELNYFIAPFQGK